MARQLLAQQRLGVLESLLSDRCGCLAEAAVLVRQGGEARVGSIALAQLSAGCVQVRELAPGLREIGRELERASQGGVSLGELSLREQRTGKLEVHRRRAVLGRGELGE